MRLFSIWIGILFCVTAQAGNKTQNAFKTNLKGGVFSASVSEGFHFNEKAPNAVTVDGKSSKPSKISAREIEFNGVPAKSADGRAVLYICDDALTFCETQQVRLDGGAVSATPTQVKKTAKNEKSAKPGKNGFIEDNFQAAVEQAQKENKPLLIDFSARWCPGCIRLEKEMFGTKEFKALTEGFVKLKIDVDRFENNVLSEKYQVQGIPTLIVVDQKQNEVSRIYDYQPLSVLQGFFENVKANPVSLADLKAKASDPAIGYELGKRLLFAGQPEEAVQYLSKVKPVPAELAWAQVDAAEKAFEKDKNNAAYIKVLREAIAAEPESTRGLNWTARLAKTVADKKEAAKISSDGLATADSLLTNKTKLMASVKNDLVGEFTGFEPLYVAFIRADIADYPGADPASVTAAWKKAGETGLALKVPFEKTGTWVRLLPALIKGELYQDADRATLALMKMNSGNAELQRRRLAVLYKLKKFDEVIDLGQRVIKNSYGRNEVLVAQQMAKAYVEAGRKKEANKFIDGWLGREELHWENMASMRKDFEDLKAKVN